MMKTFVVDNDRLRLTEDLAADSDRVVWADLFNPTKEEEARIESWLGLLSRPARRWRRSRFRAASMSRTAPTS